MSSLSSVKKMAAINELPKKEQQQLIQRRKKARHLSNVAGTLGLAALASRAPQITRAVTSATPSLRVKKPVRAILRAEPKATQVSDALGVASIGVGSANSFNWAKINRSEIKADEKSIRKGIGFTAKLGKGKLRPTGRVKGWSDNHPGFVKKPTVAVNSRGEARVIRQPDRISGEPSMMSNISEARSPYDAFEVKRNVDFGDGRITRVKKRDDKFLSEYRDRISPEAEEGYNTLRKLRNRYRLDAGLAGASAFGVPLVGAVPAYHAYKDSKRIQELHMDKIKARAYQRKQDGVYGKGRKVEKGLIPVKPRMSYGVRVGGIVRNGNKTFTRRGTIAGTGRAL